jgi:hypothetical protein
MSVVEVECNPFQKTTTDPNEHVLITIEVLNLSDAIPIPEEELKKLVKTLQSFE